MTIIRKVLLYRLLLIILLLVFFKTSISFGFDTSKIKLAIPDHSLLFLPIFVGEKIGIYNSEGIDLDIMTMRPDECIQKLSEGAVDYTGSIIIPIRFAVHGAPIKVILGIATKSPFYFMAKPEVKSIGDLKGMKIGVQSIKGNSYLFSKLALAAANISMGDVEFSVEGTTFENFCALQKGAIDATILTFPYNVLAEQKGYKELLYLGKILNIPATGLVTSDRNIKEKPNEIKKMIKATLKSISYTKKNKETVVGIIGKDWSLNLDMASAIYDKLIETISDDGQIEEGGIRFCVDLARKEIPPAIKVAPSDVSNFKLLKQVQKELNKK